MIQWPKEKSAGKGISYRHGRIGLIWLLLLSCPSSPNLVIMFGQALAQWRAFSIWLLVFSEGISGQCMQREIHYNFLKDFLYNQFAILYSRLWICRGGGGLFPENIPTILTKFFSSSRTSMIFHNKPAFCLSIAISISMVLAFGDMSMECYLNLFLLKASD